MTLLEIKRLDARMTREELAEKTGLAVRTIRALESGGVRKPKLSTLEPLADELGVGVSELALDFARAPETEAAV